MQRHAPLREETRFLAHFQHLSGDRDHSRVETPAWPVFFVISPIKVTLPLLFPCGSRRNDPVIWGTLEKKGLRQRSLDSLVNMAWEGRAGRSCGSGVVTFGQSARQVIHDPPARSTDPDLHEWYPTRLLGMVHSTLLGTLRSTQLGRFQPYMHILLATCQCAGWVEKRDQAERLITMLAASLLLFAPLLWSRECRVPLCPSPSSYSLASLLPLFLPPL